MVPVAYLPPTSCCLTLALNESPHTPHLPPLFVVVIQYEGYKFKYIFFDDCLPFIECC